MLFTSLAKPNETDYVLSNKTLKFLFLFFSMGENNSLSHKRMRHLFFLLSPFSFSRMLLFAERYSQIDAVPSPGLASSPAAVGLSLSLFSPPAPPFPSLLHAS